MTIEGFKNENIEVSEFGEWVGSNYIDYKADYKEHQKIIKELFKEKQELIDYLKEKENKLQKKVVYYEKQLKGTERNSFYYSSYLKNIHKLNAQRELIKEILSKIEKE